MKARLNLLLYFAQPFTFLLVNETKLSKFEKSDMMYWYEFTKRGNIYQY